jgi:uncharacterized protein YndB with AHSA1/START domain
VLAKIEKVKRFYVAHFEQHINASVEQVWSMLTENENVKKWFPELSIVDLQKGGQILFDFQNGTYEKFKILDVKLGSALEFTWGEDVVRFELYTEADGCTLVMNEKIKHISNHTPRDLAGWHVCIEVIKALVEGNEMVSKEELWKTSVGEYARTLAEL